MAKTIQEQFKEFHTDHPEVYEYLTNLCDEMRGRGFQRYSIGALWERLRWHFLFEVADDFKLNNNYRSRYARMLVAQRPDLVGFFELRRLQAA